jgi:hypothetical protein
MTDADIAALQYRFSGYQLPKIQFDETGPAYYVVQPHPYYSNQPLDWQKPYYYTQPGVRPDPINREDVGSKMERTNQNLSPLIIPIKI